MLYLNFIIYIHVHPIHDLLFMKFFLQVNSVECKRVIELLMGPRVTKEEFDKYMAENF